MESCPRGRRCSTRNAVYVMYLGFESLTLRQSKKQVVRPAFAFAKQKRDSNKEGADLSAEENSPVDCFRRRGQGAKRREGIRQYAEKIPNSPPKREVMLWHCFSFFVWDSNKEGADLSAEENSPVDCFRRRGQGAKRREGIWHFFYPLCRQGRHLPLQQGEA